MRPKLWMDGEGRMFIMLAAKTIEIEAEDVEGFEKEVSKLAGNYRRMRHAEEAARKLQQHESGQEDPEPEWYEPTPVGSPSGKTRIAKRRT